jgi:hypothetical protein
VGNHAITAVYSGATNFATSTGTLTGGQTVNGAATTTTVTSSVNPSTYGQSVSFTAKVTSSGGTPTGTVQFKIDGTNFGSPVSLASGSATSGATSSLSVGNHAITAVYSGATNFATSTGTLTGGQTVNGAATTTTLTSNHNPSSYNQSVTFTADVDRTSGTGTPTGSVTFWDGSTLLATVPLNSSGDATYTTSSLTVGSHTIIAIYSPIGIWAASSGGLTQVVNARSTATSVSSSRNPSTHTQSVTFTATVTSSFGTPTGTVSFYDGTTLLATVPLSSGQATYTKTSFTTGNHTITATYNPSVSTFLTSSGSVLQRVTS